MEAELVDKSYEFIIDELRHWSSWAAPKKADGSFDHDKALTGDDLIDYVDDYRSHAPAWECISRRSASTTS